VSVSTPGRGQLWAVSDLHVSHPENRELVRNLHPGSDDDWLLLAGDIAELTPDIEWVLTLLSGRFARVVWTPGNHELWTHPEDPVQLRGVARYEYLVGLCRRLGVLTPEDPYARWTGAGGPVTVAPLFLLYDYTFRPPGAATQQQALAQAYDQGVVCSDEFLLHPDPYPSREAWCRARVAATERRLADCDPELPLVLVNHFPLVREPTNVLWRPEFAQWCGSVLTRDWHRRFRTAAMVYGHLHIPRVTHHDGVRFEEVSLGYPREWRRHGRPTAADLLRPVLPTGAPVC
jgi:3',5'-cyclic AMP phosphodiesterase CpdA